MLPGLDRHFAGPELALNLRSLRSEVLASNIANADTPHYQARDFDFSAALRHALDAGGNGQASVALARTSSMHLDGTRGAAAAPRLDYRVPVQPSIDGNTVELDIELAQFSENAVRTQADLTFLGDRIRGLQTAISGQ